MALCRGDECCRTVRHGWTRLPAVFVDMVESGHNTNLFVQLFWNVKDGEKGNGFFAHSADVA